jgi:hypothetical protein
MKEFYKKYGFNIEQSIERNRKFHIVRYYPKIQTYEFINVGIILYDKDDVYYRLLQPEEVSKLHCPSLIESKVLKNSLESLDSFLQDQKSHKEVLQDISNRYKNILDTSFQLVYAGNETSEDLTKKLFYDYIGYKFDIEEKKDKLYQLIKTTQSLVSKEFKNLEVKKSKIKGYSLDFFNKKTQRIHHTLLGSIENSENVARAFLKAPLNTDAKQFYDFLNTRVNLTNHGIDNRIKLQKLDIHVYRYANEEDIAQYCERVLD